jgi:tetratricopeptide (TPR) repeat protein
LELNLRFANERELDIQISSETPVNASFVNPLTGKDLRDIRWYVETYGAQSLSAPDDAEAARIAGLLPEWGQKLFDAVFKEQGQWLIKRFQGAENESERLLTIASQHPSILALPWELLHDSSTGGSYLFNENPRISIRRRVTGGAAGRGSFAIEAKEKLHLLFVVSRPDKVGFIDPRLDPGAVMKALDQNAPGRVTWEFLRPPTFNALVERLKDKEKLAVDILHFDGHGVFDRKGNLASRVEEAGIADFYSFLQVLLRERRSGAAVGQAQEPNTGYLLFEDEDGDPHFVSAHDLAQDLQRQKVSLVILSACQSAAYGTGNKEEERQDEKAPAEAETDSNEREVAQRESMSSVAASLTSNGIPAVLAMTHSVLVRTTGILFGELYKHLARNKSIGEALDDARSYLRRNPKKFEVQRGDKRVWLELHDWFLPALYENGADAPLLKEPKSGAGPAPTATPRWRARGEAQQGDAPDGRLVRRHEAGFFGRKRELWQIERWLAGATRRVSITGFGGQGKTELALEAGRWLVRAGLFQRAAFVDYSRYQGTGVDAVGYAVACIASALDRSLLEKEVPEALRKTSTLVILDNLEALIVRGADGSEDVTGLHALLDAAVGWSEAGDARVLLTTRRPEFSHPRYGGEGTEIHRRIVLHGLGSPSHPDDALAWFAALYKLGTTPTVEKMPERAALIALFDAVRFHPLSIRVLAQQLKTRGIASVGERLSALLQSGAARLTAGPDGPAQVQDTPEGLVASLSLSLDLLDEEARAVLPRLGVFQGGAFEDNLLAITELGDTGERARKEQQIAQLEELKELDAPALLQRVKIQGLPEGTEVSEEALAAVRQKIEEDIRAQRELLAQLSAFTQADLWPGLRRQLEDAALIEAESLPNIHVPFLRFHPTLQPLLWAQLDCPGRERLTLAHRQRYYTLAGYLYRDDTRNPHEARAIARRELPNLLHAVHAALDAGDPDAVDFACSVNRCLSNFGLNQERARLTGRTDAMGGILAQSNRGEHLLAQGRTPEAIRVFQEILSTLGDAPSHERSVTLGYLGRCFLRAGGQPQQAETRYREALEVLDHLDPSDGVKLERGILQTDLADVLRQQGRYAEAREAYEAGLELSREVGAPRGEGVSLGQLGALAIVEGKLDEAQRCYREALDLFQQLGEPAMEAVSWHQLGRALEEAGQWEEAERHYREAARIKEAQGNLTGENGAASTWNQLAIVCESAGKPSAAEDWYRKAIENFRATGDNICTSKSLSNLADLLQGQRGRLPEARALAEEALAIDQTLDPGASEIWKTYTILARIAEKGAAATTDPGRRTELQTAARDHRRRAREAQSAFAGTKHGLQQHGALIQAVVNAVQQPEGKADLTSVVERYGGQSWKELREAMHRILNGERNGDALQEGQFGHSPMIIETILRALDDPSAPEGLQAEAPAGAAEAEGPSEAQKAQMAAALSALPPAAIEALQSGDVEKFKGALAKLPQSEAAPIIQSLERAGIIGREG